MHDSAGRRLKALIDAPGILVLPGVFDGFSTRLVRHAGYRAAFITGSGVSESRLGQSDVGIMGTTRARWWFSGDRRQGLHR